MAGNFRITDDLDLKAGGPKTKTNQNLAAIELLKELEAAGRQATLEEQQVLVRYSGWGGLPQVFNPTPQPEWAEPAAAVNALLDPAEYDSALDSTLNANFTSPVVIKAIYEGLSHLGFERGRILEPSMGVGYFVGLMPEAMAARSEITGIELDSITGRIARQLYPETHIHIQGFEKVALPENSFDLILSNVPYGDYKVSDPQYAHLDLQIHNYFFARSLDRVRPGGLVVFLTSVGTLQSKTSTPFRAWMSERANLVGAMRLPGSSKIHEGTEATSDLIILQKLSPGLDPSNESWIDVADSGVIGTYGDRLHTNEYYVRHPDQMLGIPCDDRLHPGRLALKPDGRNIGEAITQAFQQLPGNIYRPTQIASPLVADTVRVLLPPDVTVKNYGYVAQGEQLWQRRDNWLEPVNLGELPSKRLRGMLQIRDAVSEVFGVQLRGGDDQELGIAQGKLNQIYDEFADRYGPLNALANARVFREDPDAQLLLALEHYDPATKETTKTAIFSKRTIRPQEIRTEAESPQEALIYSLNEYGRIVPGYMASLLRMDEPQLLEGLQSQGLVYQDPETQNWQTQDEYLSGNVRQKLSVAKAAAAEEPAFEVNVKALESVQPEDLGPGQIEVRLGSPWLPTDVIADFASELLELDNRDLVRVDHVPSIATWLVDSSSSQVLRSTKNKNTYGTEDVSALKLIELALNLKDPQVYHPPDGDGRSVVNQEATLAARMKHQQIKDAFKNWVWQDFERSTRLCEIYNRTYNSQVIRQFSNPNLELPGSSPAVELRPHQKDATWRALQSEATLLAHCVGAGKTYTMCAIAMESRRLGLAKKPLIVVPNHMLRQFTNEMQQLYPNAKLLAATEKDTEKAKRKELMARIATGDWDAVIVTHSAFTRLPVSKELEKQFLQEQLAAVQAALEIRNEGSNRITKQLAAARKRLQERIETITERKSKDDGVTFEHLGIDQLLVDEAHFWKNLGRVSKLQNIAGLSNTNSIRAMDAFLKCRFIRQGGGRLVFATGTPVSNSIAELYTMQRFLQLETLKQQGIDNFDAWVGNFAEKTTAPEIDATGRFKVKTRLSKFTNIPELLTTFRDIADIKTAVDLKLPKPEAERLTIAASASPLQLKYMDRLIERAERVAARQVEPDQDNLLYITTDGRRAALDLRLVNESMPDYPESKVNLAIANVHAIWEQTAPQRSTQVIFCDLGTPKKAKEGEPRRFSIYEHIRQGLIQRGVPAEEVAFIHDYPKSKDKEQLFNAMRTGRIRVLLGSTEKMGVGMNVQQKLVALHHLDAPWRPSDIEQREGRILRQGNENRNCMILTYVTQGRDGQLGFDSYSWQTLTRKAEMVDQVMNSRSSARSVEDCSTTALSFDEIKAIATGNPLIVEKATVDNRVTELQRYQQAYLNERYTLQRRIQHDLPLQIQTQEVYLNGLKADIAQRQDTSGERFKIQLLNKTYTKREDAGKIINGLAAKITLKGKTFKDVIGEFAGFKLQACSWGSRNSRVDLRLRGTQDNRFYSVNVGETPLGTIQSLERSLAKLPRELEDAESRLTDLTQRLQEFESHPEQPFEYAQELEELLIRQQEINTALGLNKDDEQAAVQDENREETQDEQQGQKQESQDEAEETLDLESLGSIDGNWDWEQELESLGFESTDCLCEPDPQVFERLAEIMAANQDTANQSVVASVQQQLSEELQVNQLNVGNEQSTQKSQQAPSETFNPGKTSSADTPVETQLTLIELNAPTNAALPTEAALDSDGIDPSWQQSQNEQPVQPQSSAPSGQPLSLQPQPRISLNTLRDWYRIARAVGRSEEYLEQIVSYASEFKTGQPLPQKAVNAMRADVNQAQQLKSAQPDQQAEKSRITIESLRAWYCAARSLGREQRYLDRIGMVAQEFKAGKPLSSKAVSAMAQDVKAFRLQTQAQSQFSQH